MGIYSAADFNNDGFLDILSLDIIENGNISLQYGNGYGTFQPLEQIGVVWGNTPLAVFDFGTKKKLNIKPICFDH